MAAVGLSLNMGRRGMAGYSGYFVYVDGQLLSQTCRTPLFSSQGKTFWETQSIWTVGHGHGWFFCSVRVFPLGLVWDFGSFQRGLM